MQRARTTDARTPWQRLASYTESSAQSTETRGNTTSGGQKRQMHTEKQAGQMPMTFQLSKIKTGPPAVRRRKCPMAEGQRAGRRGAAGMVNQGPLRGALPCSPPAPERPAGHVPQSTRMAMTTHHPGSGKEELRVDARPGRSPRLGATGSAGRHAQPLRQKTHPTEQDAPAVVHGDPLRRQGV